MGLDMHLEAERYVSSYRDTDITVAAEAAELFPEFSNFKIKKVRAEVAYWCKANAIHGWFVQNVQDGVDECQDSFVSREKLEELRDLCKTVIDTKDSSLLPPTSGFFFGSTDVNDMYFSDLEETVEMLDKALELPYNLDFYYRASW